MAMARASTSGSISSDRQRALAKLDAVIERAECTRTRHLVHVEELSAARKDTTAARAMLRQAEDRLIRLNESRAVLLSAGLPGLEDDDDM
jgi:hypothetical protein